MSPNGGISVVLQRRIFVSGLDCEQLMLFPADSRASRLAPQDFDAENPTTVTSGRKCCELSMSCGPLGSLEKMLLGSKIWHSMIYSLTWKPSTTPQGRLLYRLQASALHTGGIDSPYWPTPTVVGLTYLSPKRVMLLKQGKTSFVSNSGIRGGISNLREWVAARTGNNGKLNPEWVEWLMGFPLGWTDLNA